MAGSAGAGAESVGFDFEDVDDSGECVVLFLERVVLRDEFLDSVKGLGEVVAELTFVELVVVIDVAMTETARLADYVLPAPTQFEKFEATFFNFDFPSDVFHLRHPVLPAPPGVLPETEIDARLVEASGAFGENDYAPLRAAAAVDRVELPGPPAGRL